MIRPLVVYGAPNASHVIGINLRIEHSAPATSNSRNTTTTATITPTAPRTTSSANATSTVSLSDFSTYRALCRPSASHATTTSRFVLLFSFPLLRLCHRKFATSSFSIDPQFRPADGWTTCCAAALHREQAFYQSQESDASHIARGFRVQLCRDRPALQSSELCSMNLTFIRLIYSNALRPVSPADLEKDGRTDWQTTHWLNADCRRTAIVFSEGLHFKFKLNV
ncbi:hypothetical protein CPB84DRAFT_1851769 [Gymnopilus junonius]|uniref:Uncharacterized protein n=1 Tax=Gymnopilus junonius TaxID=109634 RepID=A0A9P5NFG7_GYMJU|nr:hypothetical protein CPB84DRAFT_1851769 [Gymnopilus junonius]